MSNGVSFISYQGKTWKLGPTKEEERKHEELHVADKEVKGS
jgi:hypothetical protein